VVAELKRDEAPHSIHMQAINYAAMVSRLTVRDVAELYAAHRAKPGVATDLDAALAHLESGLLMTPDTIKSPRVVLVASSFPASVTASVVWLNEQGVELSLLRYRPYRLPDGQIVVSFSRLFPVPDVEEFTIGRRTDQAETAGEDVGPAWDEPSLRHLSQVGNAATQALLDLCAAAEVPVGVKDIARHADLTEGQVRGHLAGLTMLLRNARNGFAQKVWPVSVMWLPGGVASYSMDPELVAIWQRIRNGRATSSPEDGASAS
jgi:hypothetical protein